MEYIVGSLATLATIVMVIKLLRPLSTNEAPVVRYSQSHILEIIKSFIPYAGSQEIHFNSQSVNHFKSTRLKILFVENKAYWIKDNTLYVADVIDGKISEEGTKKVDTMGLDRVELEKVMFIVDKLTEGTNNDDRYPGKS
jgi:hypothetical protein